MAVTPNYSWPVPVNTDYVKDGAEAIKDLGDAVDGSLAYMPQNNQVGTTYTFTLADITKLVTAENAAASTYTIPPQASVVWVANTIIKVTNLGAGVVTFAAGGGVTVTNTASTLAQYQSASLIRTASNTWVVVPFFGGGVSPLSDSAISGTTGSPTTATYTDGGIDYKTYTWNGSGSFTLSTAGLLDILAIGGGGGGGDSAGGGAGAGGHVYQTNVYYPSGATTVTIGGGGAAIVRGSDSLAGVIVAVGGGQGAVSNAQGSNGGSGGGSSNINTLLGLAVTNQGFDGGLGTATGGNSGGGGGGGGAVGANAVTTSGGAGGAGASNSITNASVTRAGGGGGCRTGAGVVAAGGAGGGGAGGTHTGSTAAIAGTANLGGGGGGSDVGAAGGSGLVIIRVLA